MRSEKEMYELILSVAQMDERVRIVGMNGSRINPRVQGDEFQDYDIVYLVTDMESFKKDDGWLDIFGGRVIMQKPEAGTMFLPTLGGWFTYLMLFEDGNRIDLMLIPVGELDKYLANDSITAILLDKDSLVRQMPVPSDRDYHVKRPNAAFYDECANEFWWTVTYVAKGLCRKEMLYALWHMDRCVREELIRMLSWKVGIDTGFGVSVGKCCKYMDKYLTEAEMKLLLATSGLDSPKGCRQGLGAAMDLFRQTCAYVGSRLGYEYPDYDAKVTGYLCRLHQKYPDEI